MKNSSKCQGYLWRLYFHVENAKWTLAWSSPCNTLFFFIVCHNCHEKRSGRRVNITYRLWWWSYCSILTILVYMSLYLGVWIVAYFQSRTPLSIFNECNMYPLKFYAIIHPVTVEIWIPWLVNFSLRETNGQQKNYHLKSVQTPICLSTSAALFGDRNFMTDWEFWCDRQMVKVVSVKTLLTTLVCASVSDTLWYISLSHRPTLITILIAFWGI